MSVFDPIHAADGVISSLHPLVGMARLHHVTDRGGPLAFAHAPFLVELYRDLLTLDDVVVCKAVQVHVSELQILASCYEAGWLGRTVAYVLPTHGGRDNFVQRRIDRLLTSVPEYRRRYLGDVDASVTKVIGNLRRKQLGPGFLLFLGSNAPAEFLEFSADSLVVDEYDHCDPENLSKAYNRIRESPHGGRHVRFGNPTFPTVGISALYSDSDGRRFYYRCEHCGERQPTDWEVNVIRKTGDGRWELRDTERSAALTTREGRVVPSKDPSADVRPVCRRCARPYDRSAMGDACGWVAECPETGRRRGYRVSRLDLLRRSLSALFVEFLEAQRHSDKLASFHRSVLGFGYEGGGTGLAQDELDRASTGPSLDYVGGDAYATQLVTAGIDVGNVFNVQISVAEPGPDGRTKRVARYVGAVRTEDEVVDLLRRFRVQHAAIDMLPETRIAQSIRDRAKAFGCDVWLCKYSPRDRVGMQSYGAEHDWATRVVSVDHTQVIDAATDLIRNGDRVFPVDVGTVFGWSVQMRDTRRGLNEAGTRIVWEKGTRDDYRFADVYDLVAYDTAQLGGRFIAVG